MHIFLFFFLAPLGVGALLEYALCRFPKKRLWRRIPPMLLAAVGIGILIYRHLVWDRDGSGAPVETLLFFPGLPVLGLTLGLLAGWLLWRRLWLPRVVRDRGKTRRGTGGRG